ncbi:hypothetical protein N7537_000030 [Penicillium hordei]|uniref:Uncharacterized protein n=1 Tax=Penicillium hordei TaxID=40994 RepID=A0AAD6EDC7_9EURO|nr:uncharacterized protein N7537_000030 [Penicillium hordei]KAJ5614916.1 hypothetical protein N7537_000030 [Penicillium hordei]
MMITVFHKAWRLTRGMICHNMHQPGNFRWSPTSLSDISCTNVDPIFPIDYASPQQTASQKNSLPLLQFGDWEEGRTYDEDAPACIHYLFEFFRVLDFTFLYKR